MKYNEKNKPLICMQTQSTCYRGTRVFVPKGILWHCTGANNPNLKRYVQPSNDAADRDYWLSKLGKNAFGNDWNHQSVQAGLNFWIGKLADGTVSAVQTMPWNYRPWGCGNGSKGSCNNTHIQFEICEDALNDRAYFNAVYQEACEMTAYLCQMFKIDPKGKTTCGGVTVPTILCHQDSYRYGLGSNHSDVYNWFNRFGKTMDDVRNDVAALLAGGETSSGSGGASAAKGIQASSLKSLTNEQIVKKVGPLFTADQKKTGILASVSMAQFILESAYGKSELAQNANNCFGMKRNLSGNTWAGSTWDGTSVYAKQTQEQSTSGAYSTITADFRKYACIEDSIADHSAYLLGAKKGTALRYAGLKGCTDYKKAAQIIKDGGYATSLAYVQNLCTLIEKWDLTAYDVGGTGAADTSGKKEEVVVGKKTPNITVGVKTLSAKLPDVKNGKEAGNGKMIVGVKIGVDIGTVKYRVHCGGRWLPVVTGNDWSDYNNGYAGDDVNYIDAIQIYYTSDRSQTGVYDVVYAAKPIGFSKYLPEVEDTNWEAGDGDHTAGIFGQPIGHLKISLVKA